MPSSTIAVFVGCAPNHEDAESQAVLEYSIRKHASLPVELTWMHHSRDPESPFYGWNAATWATPFSGFRWAVPALAHAAGHARAVYMDSDFIVLDDLAKLIDQPIPEGRVALGLGGAHWRMCLSVFDVERALEIVPPLDEQRRDPGTHGRMNVLFRDRGLVHPFSGDWNNMELRTQPDLSKAQALHYTDMRTQPQLRHAIPRLEAEGRRHWFDGRVTVPHPNPSIQALFDELLEEAAEHGYPVEKYTEHEPFGDVAKRSFGGRR